jgi:hypothetical protein
MENEASMTASALFPFTSSHTRGTHRCQTLLLPSQVVVTSAVLDTAIPASSNANKRAHILCPRLQLHISDVPTEASA